jgi:magnesium transporter
LRIPLHNLFKRYSQRAGLPPGTLVYVGEERTERVQVSFIDYNESYLHEREVKTIEECLPFIPAETVTWVRIEGIHVAGFISEIGEHFGVNSLVLEDVMNPTQHPKIEIYEDYVFGYSQES